MTDPTPATGKDGEGPLFDALDELVETSRTGSSDDGLYEAMTIAELWPEHRAEYLAMELDAKAWRAHLETKGQENRRRDAGWSYYEDQVAAARKSLENRP